MLTTEREDLLLHLIALRAGELGRKYGIDFGTVSSLLLKLSVVHGSITPLDLREMLDAPDSSFMKDIVGIDAHLQMSPVPRFIGAWWPRHARGGGPDASSDLFRSFVAMASGLIGTFA